MRQRLRVPRHLVVIALSSGALATSVVASSCRNDDQEQCVRCLADPSYSDDAGVDAAPCPPCLPDDGVCPSGCIPEGYV
jgi:hypothetical protein